jgi:hypothetical protein
MGLREGKAKSAKGVMQKTTAPGASILFKENGPVEGEESEVQGRIIYTRFRPARRETIWLGKV